MRRFYQIVGILVIFTLFSCEQNANKPQRKPVEDKSQSKEQKNSEKSKVKSKASSVKKEVSSKKKASSKEKKKASSEKKASSKKVESKKEQEKPIKLPPEKEIIKLMQKKLCMSCHSLTTARMIGPGLRGLYGKKQIVMTKDGKEREVVIDKEYLRRALQQPMVEVPKGYPPGMLPAPLTKEDVEIMVEYIKNLK